MNRKALLIAALAFAATSCSRALPTSPVSTRDADAFRSGTGSTGGATPSAQTLSGQVAVTLAPGVTAATIAQAYGATVVTYVPSERTASFLPPAGVSALTFINTLAFDSRVITRESNTWIENAEARQQSFAFDDGFNSPLAYAQQTAATLIHLTDAHQVATGRNVKVAIIDTGVDATHAAFAGHVVGGWDFVSNDADPSDTRDFTDNDGDGRVDEAFGHGTHVAGIVRLVAPDAQLLVVRVLDADGRGDLVTVAAGVRWAVQHGAKVINLSLGSNGRLDALQDVLNEAELAGVTVIATAGNWGTNKLVDFPGTSSHAMCVAAVDGAGVGAAFSSTGSEVELSAPGVAIRSAYPGDTYKQWSGTSMAAPFVTGTVALLAEKHPAWNLVEMENRLQSTTSPLAGVPSGGKASLYGAGVLDAGAALAADRTLGGPAGETITMTRGR
jgi:subtilisin family serine protease